MTDETPIEQSGASHDDATHSLQHEEATGQPPVRRFEAPNPVEGDPPPADHVREALKVVIDPELGISVVDLGLVYDIEVDDEVIKITYTLTSMGCPVGPLIEQQMQQILTQMPGVRYVESNLVFDPPWSPEKMSEDAKIAMGMF